jgi:uncharacterized membrane protein YcaP (DUF421 family)
VDLLTPQLPVHETLIRAILVYLVVCVLIRLVPKRQAGNISPQDMVGAVIVGGLAVSGIADAKAGPADIVMMIALVLGLNYALDWVGDRFPWLRRLIREPPTCLIRDGQVLLPAMRREMLTEEELLAQLRKQGVEDISRVKAAYLEANGEVSVVEAGGESAPSAADSTTPAPADPKPSDKTKRGTPRKRGRG